MAYELQLTLAPVGLNFFQLRLIAKKMVLHPYFVSLCTIWFLNLISLKGFPLQNDELVSKERQCLRVEN